MKILCQVNCQCCFFLNDKVMVNDKFSLITYSNFSKDHLYQLTVAFGIKIYCCRMFCSLSQCFYYRCCVYLIYF